MTTIRIVLDTPVITADQTRELAQGVRQWLPDFLKAYGLPPHDVEVSMVDGPLGTINVRITDDKRADNALGYHGQENGYPAAWISPTACNVTAEYPTQPKELWDAIRTNSIFGIYIPTVAQPPFMAFGLASVLAHEIQELLVDPDPMGVLANPTANPTEFGTDKNGMQWLKEPGDHANPGHFVINVATRLRQSWRKGWRVITVHRLMVIADATLPSFYDLKGVAPFTFAQLMVQLKKVVAAAPAAITYPFDWVTGAYGWRQGTTGGSMNFFARSDTPDSTIGDAA